MGRLSRYGRNVLRGETKKPERWLSPGSQVIRAAGFYTFLTKSEGPWLREFGFLARATRSRGVASVARQPRCSVADRAGGPRAHRDAEDVRATPCRTPGPKARGRATPRQALPF